MTQTTVADWLKSDGLRHAESHEEAVAWGAIAVESSIRTAFDQSLDAAAEGARQLEFLGEARVIDRVAVPGLWSVLAGQAVTLTADATGYRDGALVFVIEANEQEIEGHTMLKVIRRIA